MEHEPAVLALGPEQPEQIRSFPMVGMAGLLLDVVRPEKLEEPGPVFRIDEPVRIGLEKGSDVVIHAAAVQGGIGVLEKLHRIPVQIQLQQTVVGGEQVPEMGIQLLLGGRGFFVPGDVLEFCSAEIAGRRPCNLPGLQPQILPVLHKDDG